MRDVARWYDVCAGYDFRDPYSLPDPGGWEAGLGTHDLAGLRVERTIPWPLVAPGAPV